MAAEEKHLEMAQAVINRLANNSFLLRGWSITLISAIFVLAAREDKSFYFFVAFIPAILFWYLDAYYLRLERLYRLFYEELASASYEGNNYSLRPEHLKGASGTTTDVFFSHSVIIFHGSMAAVVFLVSVFSAFCTA